MDAFTTNANPPLVLPWRLGPWLRRAYGAHGKRTSRERLVLAFSDDSSIAYAVMRALVAHAQRLVVVFPPEELARGGIESFRQARPNMTFLTAVSGDPRQVRECFDRALSIQGAIDAVVNIRRINTESRALATAALLAAHRHAHTVAEDALECLQPAAGGILVDASVYNEDVTALALPWVQNISNELRNLCQPSTSRAVALATLSCALPHCHWPRRAGHSQAARDLARTVETTLLCAWDGVT